MAETDNLSPSSNPPGEASTENSIVEANGSTEDAIDVSKLIGILSVNIFKL